MRGVFCKKKWKKGEGVVKKWTFPQRRVHYVQYQYFFNFTFYLFGWCVRTQRTPTGLIINLHDPKEGREP